MRRWIQQFIGRLDSDVSQPLRIRLFRLMCLTTCVLCLAVVLPANYFQDLPVMVNVADALLGLFAGYCYWASARGRHYLLTFFAVLMVLLEPVWFLNAGSQGSIIYYYYAEILYPLALLRGRARWILTVLIIVNIVFLLLFEYAHPELTVAFQHPRDR